MSGAWGIFRRNVTWRFQHPVTIVMSLVQPLLWLVIFSSLLGGNLGVGRDAGDFTAFMLPGIFVMDVLAGAGMSGIAIYFTRANGSFFRMVISPVPRAGIVAGHVLDVAVLVFIQTLALSCVAALMGVRPGTGFVGVALASALILTLAVLVSCVSLALGMAVPDENGFVALVNTFTLPLFFLSTALIERDRAPGIFRVLISLNPFTYAIDSLRNLLLDRTVDWGAYGFAFGLFAALGSFAFLVAIRSLRFSKR